MFTKIAIAAALAVLTASASAPAWAEEKDLSRQVKKPVRQAIDTRQATQQAEEQWRDQKEKHLAEYERLQAARQQLLTRQQQLQQEITAAQERIADKQKQLGDHAQISGQIEPFLKELAGRVRDLVAGDMPFLAAEREQRAAKLTQLMDDPQVPVSDKFRKAMEALLVEAEYGNTIEVYQETITVGDRPALVNVFRLGRVSLFYQTLDQKRCGFYDVSAGGWRALNGAYNRSLHTAMEIGAKRRPVELLALPLGRMADR